MTTTKKGATQKEKKKSIKQNRHPLPSEVSSARKYKAWEMRVMNPHMTFAEITKKLNELFPNYPLRSHHQAVEKMIKEAEKEYIAAHKVEVDTIKAEAGIAMDWVRHEAAEAWERSKELVRVVKKREEHPIEQILKGSAGEPQFLKRITESVEVKAKVFGALAPKKHEVTGRDGAPLLHQPYDLKVLGKYLSNDDLDKIQEAVQILERTKLDHDTAIHQGD
ncbi:MAG TPA: hypothetical protein DCS05_01670 [Nitrospiraceae bacterium]|nr:hypothetical protein [Nitrospiraceae bacterium]